MHQHRMPANRSMSMRVGINESLDNSRISQTSGRVIIQSSGRSAAHINSFHFKNQPRYAIFPNDRAQRRPFPTAAARHSVLTSRICSTVQHGISRRRGLATISARLRAREIATFRRFLL